MNMDTEDSKEFSLSSASKEFSNRQKQIFGSLANLEQVTLNNLKNNKNTCDNENNETLSITNKRKRAETKHFRGRESMFKRPEAPISKCLPPRRQPDFKINPHKWQKYSLEDVTQEDMSNRQNTAAALSFLRELEDRKNISILNEETMTEVLTVKPKFNSSASVSKKLKTRENDADEKALFKSSTLVMPEYVVGQRKKKEKKIHTAKSEPNCNKKQLKLDHLLESDPEENC